MTIPTDAQLLAGLRASRGDHVYGEDEDTRALEERIARLTGKEDCLFGVSGTMTNRECARGYRTLRRCEGNGLSLTVQNSPYVHT